jgi:polyferredoxin
MRTFVIGIIALFAAVLFFIPLLGLVIGLIGMGIGILASVLGALISIPLALLGIAVGAGVKLIGFILSAIFWALVIGVVVWLAIRFFQTKKERPSSPVDEVYGDLHDFREGVRKMRKRVDDLETILRNGMK